MPEIVNPPTESQINALVRTAAPFSLLPEVQAKIIDTLAPFVQQAGEIAREAEGVQVTDASQTDLIAQSRALRLRMGKVRVAADKARKSLKEEFLRPGQAIDAAGRHILSLIEPVETRLIDQEKIVERQEEQKRNLRRLERVELLTEYTPDIGAYDLAGMSDKAFADLIAGQKALAEQRKAQAEKAEAERRADQEAFAAKAKAAEAEAAQLRKEAEEANAKAQVEREQVATALANANAARAKAEREAKAITDAADQKKRDEANAARRAARAPDKEKIDAVAGALLDIKLPSCTTPEGQKVMKWISESIAVFAVKIIAQAREL